MKFSAKKCQHDVMRCDPIPDKEFLKEYYNKKYYQEGLGSYNVTYTSKEIEHKIFEADLLFHAISRKSPQLIPQKSSFLELGCGEGFVLAQALKNQFNPVGVDFSRFGVDKYNPQVSDFVIEGDLYNFLDDEHNNAKFDLCVLKNVFEHVVDPKKLFNKIKRVLKIDGRLALTVPNDFSALQNLLLEKKLVKSDEWFCPPDHIFYFNTDNIKSFVQDFNFNILDIYTSFPVDVFLLNKHSNYYFDREKGKEAHYSRIEFELLMKKSGFDNVLSFGRSMARAGIGRNINIIMESKHDGK